MSVLPGDGAEGQVEKGRGCEGNYPQREFVVAAGERGKGAEGQEGLGEALED